MGKTKALRQKDGFSSSTACDISVNNIKLVGINRLTNPCVGFLRRLLWAALLITGSLCAFSITIMCIRLYLSGPVRIQVTSVVESVLELPAITICTNRKLIYCRDKYDFNSLLELWKEAGYTEDMPSDADMVLLSNYTIEEIWVKGGYKFDILVVKCFVGPRKKCEEAGKWKSSITRHGLCYTFYDSFIVNSGNLFGFYVKLQFRKHPYGKPFLGFIVGLHDEKTSEDYVMQSGLPCAIKYMKQGCNAMIAYKFQEHHLLNRPNSHCNSSAIHDKRTCLLGCLHNFITSISKCRLPYMKVNSRLCQTRAEVDHINKLVDKYDFNGEFWNQSNCECIEPCHYKSFYWTADTTWKKDTSAVIKVYSNDLVHKTSEEIYSYKEAALAGDVGGIFGLMLAASSLTFIQVLEVLVVKIASLFKRMIK